MKKSTILNIAIGISICLSIIAFSLSLYFGLHEDDGQPLPVTTPNMAEKTTTMSGETMTTMHQETDTVTTSANVEASSTGETKTTMAVGVETSSTIAGESTSKLTGKTTTTVTPTVGETSSTLVVETSTPTGDTTTRIPFPDKNNGSKLTPMDEFVYSTESMNQYSWYRVNDMDYNGTSMVTNMSYTAHILNLTSGEWRTEADVGVRHSWWHCFVVIVPEVINPEYENQALIWVSGYDNDDNGNTGFPGKDDEFIVGSSILATGLGIVAGILNQIPNQPVIFTDDPQQMEREEDRMIAYTWAEYLEELDNPELIAYLPMVRGAVRSMDCITEFMQEEYSISIEQFFFTGFSKRGWTTWLTGAMENGPLGHNRVKAIMPGVWDAINFQEVFQNQWMSFNGWSFAVHDFVDNGIMPYMGTPELVHLQNIIDPYFYRTRLTMPKLVITGIMDEFQMTDDEQHWWDEMPSGPTDRDPSEYSNGNTKWLMKSPNAEHGQSTAIRTDLNAYGMFLTYLLNDWDIPYLTWDYDPANGDITAYTYGGEVLSAQIWMATTCNETVPDFRRDLRIASLDDPCNCGIVGDEDTCITTESWWHETKLTVNSDGYSYSAHVDPPGDNKWSSYIVQVHIKGNHTMDWEDERHTLFTRGLSDLCEPVGAQPKWPNTPCGYFEFSTRASVVPNEFPYPPCSMDGCIGPLV